MEHLESAAGGRSSVLVIDDEAGVRLAIAVVLGARFEVCTVSSGEEALEALQDRRFDLITLDAVMPGMSGLETLERLRVLDRTAPVLMISASSTRQMVERAEGLGAFGWLIKPFECDELVRVMGEADQALRARRERATAS